MRKIGSRRARETWDSAAQSGLVLLVHLKGATLHQSVVVTRFGKRLHLGVSESQNRIYELLDIMRWLNYESRLHRRLHHWDEQHPSKIGDARADDFGENFPEKQRKLCDPGQKSNRMVRNMLDWERKELILREFSMRSYSIDVAATCQLTVCSLIYT